MRFSVYNKQTAAYDYYEAPVPATDAPPNPKHLRPRGLGIAPTEAGWPLPLGSKWVGRGKLAQGFVASPLGDSGSSPVNMVAVIGFLGAAYLLMRSSRS